MTLASRYVLKALDRLAAGRLTLRLPDGATHVFGTPNAELDAEIEVKDWRFFRRVLLDGDIGFAESYMDGYCDSPELPKLLALFVANDKALGNVAHSNVFHNIALKLMHRRRDNSREGRSEE